MQTLLQHPRLMDCRRLFLRNYEVWINIGVHDFEKKGEQRVLINVDLFIPMALSTPSKDTLDEVVDYDFIRRSIAGRVARGHVHLQETLVDDVLATTLPGGIVLGALTNLSGLPIPGPVAQAVDMVAAAAIPAALFALGGILAQYRPEGDLKLVAYVAAVSLILHPGIVYGLAHVFGLGIPQTRSAVLMAAMAPGVNAYVFASMYDVAKRVSATAVLVATAVSILSIWVWLAILP